MNNHLGDLVNGSRHAANHSFIFGFLKIILACYFVVFLFEIYKHIEDSIRSKRSGTNAEESKKQESPAA